MLSLFTKRGARHHKITLRPATIDGKPIAHQPTDLAALLTHLSKNKETLVSALTAPVLASTSASTSTAPGPRGTAMIILDVADDGDGTARTSTVSASGETYHRAAPTAVRTNAHQKGKAKPTAMHTSAHQKRGRTKRSSQV